MAGHWFAVFPSLIAAFLSSLVEGVEALTVLLAIGATRGWRSASAGGMAGLATLLLIAAVSGPQLVRFPLHVIQLSVGTFILLFGLRWLRKAIFRSSSIVPMHDEGAAYRKEVERMQKCDGRHADWDWKALMAAFQIVMLEGLEVIFIVVAIGANGHGLPAVSGAVLALIAVCTAGILLRRPLEAVPENTLKLTVAIILTAIGTNWVGEGAGLQWPGGDMSLPILLTGYFTAANVMIRVLRHARAAPRTLRPAKPDMSGRLPKIIKTAIGLFVDDGSLATGALLCVVVAWGCGEMELATHSIAAPCLFVGITMMLVENIFRTTRASAVVEDKF